MAIPVLLALVVSTLTACTSTPGDDIAESGVGKRGFSLRLEDARAYAGAGVAPVDTHVRLKLVGHRFEGLPKELVPVGPSISLSLADGKVQPRRPIKIELKVDKSKIRAHMSAFVAVSQREGAKRPEVIVGRYNAKSGFVEFQTTHLSPFALFGFDIGDFMKGVADRITRAWGVNFPSPDCELSGETSTVLYSMSVHAGVVPCFSVERGRGHFVIHSVSSNPYRLTASPTARGSEGVGLDLKGLAQVGLSRAMRLNKEVTTLLPGGTVAYDIDDAAPLAKLDFTQDPSVTLIGVLFAVLDASGVLGKIEAARNTADGLGALQCLGSLTQPLGGDLGKQSDTVIRAFIDCVGLFAGGVTWTLITVAPGVLLSLVLGIVNELTGNGHFTLDVKTTPLIRDVGFEQFYSPYASAEGIDSAYGFDSPSHNISCGVYVMHVGDEGPDWACRIHKHAIAPLPEFKGSEIGCGGLIVVRPTNDNTDPSSGLARYACAGGEEVPNEFGIDDPTRRNLVLPFNGRVTISDIQCTMSNQGGETVSCRNTATKTSFTLNSKKYVLHQGATTQ